MTPLVAEGMNLALYGMGTVFVFLTLLVLATKTMSWLVAKMPDVISDEMAVHPRKLAAISAAVHQRRIRSK